MHPRSIHSCCEHRAPYCSSCPYHWCTAAQHTILRYAAVSQQYSITFIQQPVPTDNQCLLLECLQQMHEHLAHLHTTTTPLRPSS